MSKKMSVKAFLKKFNGAALDQEELMEIASDVEGEVGETASAALLAIGKFEDALEAIDFEVG